eukprot:CAMPEP_0195051922 /NCGR_PEP_ID=MMETSP0448-20130528/1334_1 /TAXON_ID=66468 /ORGANISM="Heterocapsa triquestra, Strain CCMP 448" /LENGTH=58 /DNA_ID=CAMNT_0040080969 /DNA_START=53 /DNA_END=229 /DNA_ORIENTATION=-
MSQSWAGAPRAPPPNGAARRTSSETSRRRAANATTAHATGNGGCPAGKADGSACLLSN